MQKLKTIREAELKDKEVVLRVDFNCPLAEGKVADPFRIEQSLKTFRFLIEGGVKKIFVLSHLGRPAGEFKAEFSLAPVVDYFREELGKENPAPKPEVRLIEYSSSLKECLSKARMAKEKIIFLENIRFFPEEEKGEVNFAKILGSLGEIFVNDAFSACHRKHASIVGIPRFSTSYAGLLLEEEVTKISEVVTNPQDPAIAVLGGAKLETKLPLIKILAKNYTNILIGGLLSIELEKEGRKQYLSLEEKIREKIILPSGYVSQEKKDINKASAEKFRKIIKTARTILWNGPMGKYEEPPFDEGSRIVGLAIAEAEAFKLAGGGETNELIKRLGIAKKINFISTGGGALLKFAAGEKMPGIESLLK